MDITGFEKVAQYLTHPLALIGFVLMLVFGMHKEIVKSGLLPQVSKKDGSEILKLILRYGFWLGLVLVLAGFLLQFSGIGLSAWNSYMEKEKVIQVNAGKLARELVGPLQGQLEAKDQQIKALTEAITALSKTGAPTASINEALQALQQGHTAQAQAIFAEVLRSKEAEGRQANKEAAAAARHLGALAFLNDTKAALAAYQKAVELDPDNAEGWNQLGRLLKRTGELDKAEKMHKKAVNINQNSGCKEGTVCANINLGHVHQTRGDLDKAEQLYKAALEISQSLGNKEGMAMAYSNLGSLAYTHGELDKAEKMHRKSFELNQALGRKEGMASDYSNLGCVAHTRGELDKAEEMHRKSFELNQALASKEGMARDYGNLGSVYGTRGELDKAEEMYRKALALHEALGSKEGMARDYGNLGIVYKKRGNLAQAEELWKKSLRLFQEMNHPDAKKVQQWIGDLAEQRSSSH